MSATVKLHTGSVPVDDDGQPAYTEEQIKAHKKHLAAVKRRAKAAAKKRGKQLEIN